MECRKGYFGDFCDEPCPAGFFGFRCGGKCFPKCSIKDCNHVSGCSYKNENTSKTSYKEVFTVEGTSQRLCTSCVTSTSSMTSEIVITDDKKIELHRNYLIVGGGIFISLILLIILLQLYTCKKSTTARTNTKSKTCKEIGKEESEEQHVTQEESGHASKYITKTRSNISQPVECDYHDIDEIKEIRHLASFSKESPNYELPRLLTNSRHSYSPLTVENSYLSPQFSDNSVEPQGGHSSKNNADFYLQPINVLKYASVASDC